MNVMAVQGVGANCDDNRHRQRDRLVRLNPVVVAVHGELRLHLPLVAAALKRYNDDSCNYTVVVIRALDGIRNQHQLNVHQDLKQFVDNLAQPKKF